jgi:hypothetical protein
MLKVTFGEQTMEGTLVFVWFSKFKSGVTSVKDENAGDIHQWAEHMKICIGEETCPRKQKIHYPWSC